MIISVHGNSGDADPSRACSLLAIAPLAMEVEVLVDQLEADLLQDGYFSAEVTDRVHDLRARAARLFT